MLELGQEIAFDNFGGFSTGTIRKVNGDGTYKVSWNDGYVDTHNEENYAEKELKPLY